MNAPDKLGPLLSLTREPFPASRKDCLTGSRHGGSAHLQAQGYFNAMGKTCKDAGIPWVMLSAGVTPEQFVRVMEYAYAGGAHGYLAGRAVWLEAMQHFPDLAKCAVQLRQQGGETLARLEALTRHVGHAWHADYSAFEEVKAEGELCAAYA